MRKKECGVNGLKAVNGHDWGILLTKFRALGRVKTTIAALYELFVCRQLVTVLNAGISRDLYS
jgi:hypothetical protein